jgi:iron complex transport system substrate-binding protein
MTFPGFDAAVLRSSRRRLSLLGAALLLAAAVLPVAFAPRVVADAAEAVAPHKPRLISLAPNLTEIAYAAGAGSMLVGTVEFSDYPEAAQAVPRVGDAWRVDPERVLELRPDVVLVWPTGTPAATISRLRSLGLNIVEVPTQSLADVPRATSRPGWPSSVRGMRSGHRSACSYRSTTSRSTP